METFNGVTKLGFLLLAFRVLSKEFYFKKTEMKIRVRVTPSACCLLPGDGRQIASGEHPAVLPSTVCEVREGGSTFLAPEQESVQGGPGGSSVGWSFVVFGKRLCLVPQKQAVSWSSLPGQPGSCGLAASLS